MPTRPFIFIICALSSEYTNSCVGVVINKTPTSSENVLLIMKTVGIRSERHPSIKMNILSKSVIEDCKSFNCEALFLILRVC